MVQRKYYKKKDKSLKVFILGGRGFVGSAISNHLSKYYRITIISKNNYKNFLGKKCDILINANGNSKKFLSNDILFDFEKNVHSTLKSINEFIYDKYIHISSVDVYSKFSKKNTKESSEIDIHKISNYGFHKYLSELLIKKHCKKWTIFRLSGMIGENLSKGPYFDISNNCQTFVNDKSKFHFLSTNDLSKIIHKSIYHNFNKRIINVATLMTLEIKDLKKLFNNKHENSKDKILNYSINIDILRSFFNPKKSVEYVKNDKTYKLFSKKSQKR